MTTLAEQHANLGDLLTAMQRQSAERRSGLLEQFRCLLAPHLIAERLFLHRTALSQRGLDQVRVKAVLDRSSSLSDSLAILENTPTDSLDFEIGLGLLAEAIGEHASDLDWELQALLPQLEPALLAETEQGLNSADAVANEISGQRVPNFQAAEKSARNAFRTVRI